MKKVIKTLIIVCSTTMLVSTSCSNNGNKEAAATKDLATANDSVADGTGKTYPISEESKKEAREKLEGYRQLVLNGDSMAKIARLYSEDPGSSKNGGLYEGIKKGAFVPEFEAVAFNLKQGEISEIFQTKYGFHFVQLVAHQGDSINVRHVLVVPKHI